MKNRNAKEHSREIERREFLGVGAALGASAYVGGDDAPIERPVKRRVPSRDKRTCMEKRNAPIEWAIPAQHLNTLWTLLWPRAAARVWLSHHPWPESCGHDGKLRDISRDIQVWIESFLGRDEVDGTPVSFVGELRSIGNGDLVDDPIATPAQLLPSRPSEVPPGTDPAISIGGSERFKDALKSLHAYLTLDHRPPIRFIGVGSFDFLISDAGIDLWAPPSIGPINSSAEQINSSAEHKKLMSYYEYRRAGRPPISIGGVLDPGPQENPLTLIESPTGPGQVESIDPCLIGSMCLDLDGESILRICGVSEGAQAKVNHIRLRPRLNRTREHGPGVQVVPPNSGLELYDLLEMLLTPELPEQDDDDLDDDEREKRTRLARERESQLSDLDALDIDTEYPEIEPQLFDEAIEWILRHTPPQDVCRSVSPESYRCCLLETQCWVLSGSVYRGILEQFPRIVAGLWADDPASRVDQIPTEGTPPRPGLKVHCERRMETSFPDEMRLERVDDPPVADHAAIPAGVWDDKQLMVTNVGIFFPKTVGHEGDTSATPLERLLVSIVDGRAGNPVFTDSSRCL